MMRWYVYHLVDPRNDEIFYIGKGTGRRSKQHLANVRHGREFNPAKAAKIKSILADNLEPIDRHIAYFRHSNDAYDYESSQIKALKPSTNGTTGNRPRKYSLLALVCDACYKRGGESVLLIKRHFPEWFVVQYAHPELLKLYRTVINLPTEQSVLDAYYSVS